MSSKLDESDKPVDVLAAEEFPLGGPDPDVDQPPAPVHDVLAADEFEVPAPDPKLEAREQTAAHDHPRGAGARPLNALSREMLLVAAVSGILLGLVVLRWLKSRDRQRGVISSIATARGVPQHHRPWRSR